MSFEFIIAFMLSHPVQNCLLSVILASGRAFDDAISRNKSIAAESFPQGCLEEPGALASAEALQHNSISTPKDCLGEPGVLALATALQHDSTLTRLHLRKNDIGDQGARMLAAALQHHPSVTSVVLLKNKIGPAGVAALAQMLRAKTKITCVDLRSNQIGDEGAQILADLLMSTDSLSRLVITHNGIGVAGMSALCQAMQVNPSITILQTQEFRLGSKDDAVWQSFHDEIHKFSKVRTRSHSFCHYVLFCVHVQSFVVSTNFLTVSTAEQEAAFSTSRRFRAVSFIQVTGLPIFSFVSRNNQACAVC
jgi:hypothetical protein